MPKNLKRLVDDATENYGPGSGWEEEFGEIIAGARVELARYDEAIRLLEDWRKCGDLETNEMPYGDTAAFLAAEGKVAG